MGNTSPSVSHAIAEQGPSHESLLLSVRQNKPPVNKVHICEPHNFTRFTTIMLTAIETVMKAVMRPIVVGESQVPTRTPRSIPARLPANTHAVSGQLIRPNWRWPTTPPMEIQAMMLRDVPIASLVGNPRMTIRAGTTMNQPPTPNKPFMVPTASPMPPSRSRASPGTP